MVSCAIGEDRKLLDATDIEWFNDANDTHPLPLTSSAGTSTDWPCDRIYLSKGHILGTCVDTDDFHPVLGCGHRVKNTGVMRSAINKLGEDDDGQPIQSTGPTWKCATKCVGSANWYSALDVEETSDAEDGDFSDEMPGLLSNSDSEPDSDEDKQIMNEEVFQMYILVLSLLTLHLLKPQVCTRSLRWRIRWYARIYQSRDKTVIFSRPDLTQALGVNSLY